MHIHTYKHIYVSVYKHISPPLPRLFRYPFRAKSEVILRRYYVKCRSHSRYMLFSGSDDECIRVWDLHSHTPVAEMCGEHTNKVWIWP